MRENDDGKTVAAMDMLVPRVLCLTLFILSTIFVSDAESECHILFDNNTSCAEHALYVVADYLMHLGNICWISPTILIMFYNYILLRYTSGLVHLIFCLIDMDIIMV